MIEVKKINNVLQWVRQLFCTKEVMVNILICMVWASSFVLVLRAFFNRIPILTDYIDEAVAVCFIIPTLLSIPVLIRRFTLFDYIFYLMWPLLYLLNYIVYPENEPFLIDTAYKSLCIAAPCYFIGRLLDIEKFFKVFIILSTFCILWELFYYFSYVQTMKNAKDMASILKSDNMSAAYNILPHVIFMFWATMRKFRIFTLVMGVIGLLLILSFGSRGPLACLGFFILVYFLFFLKNKYSKYIKIGVVSLVLLIIPFTVEFTFIIKYMFEELNLSTRIVDRILTGGMTHDTGRSGLRDTLYNILDNSDNIFGFGIYGCERYGIIYAHNFFCDIFFTFGYYVGSIIIIAFLSLLLYAFIIAKSMERQGLLFLFSLSFVKLMLSNTFIADSFFFMLIGYSVYVIFKNNCNPKLVFNEN